MEKVLIKKRGAHTGDDEFQRVGGERNKHGTRICRQIVCSACKKPDYVSVHVYRETTLCRQCAKQKLNLFEQSVQIPKKQNTTNCTRCGVSCDLPKSVKDASEWLCLDCLRGFDVWSGPINNKRQDTVIETRSSGTLLRKRKKQT